MHKGYVMSLFVFLILIYALNFKVRNVARVLPSSDHRVYISGCMADFIVVCTHMWLVKAEPLS